jgi:hypothetical protein
MKWDKNLEIIFPNPSRKKNLKGVPLNQPDFDVYSKHKGLDTNA